MTSPFGGTVRFDGSTTREALSPSLVTALGTAFAQPHPPIEGLSDDDARVVFFAFEGDEMVYATDLSGASPWGDVALPHADALGLLARVARTLSALHGRALVHGDLRPEAVAVDGQRRVALLTPARASAAGAVLRARLHPGGAGPATVAFASPEVVAGTEVTAASDVYSLAALTYATLTGNAPVGQVNLQHYAAGPQGDLARMVAAALDQTPARRPTMEALAAEIARAAARATQSSETQGTPYRTGPAIGDDASPTGPTKETSPVLILTLLVGGFITFLGAVMLVSLGWAVAGALGRVVLLAAMSAAAWGLGAVANRYKIEAGVVVARAISGIFATVAIAFTFSQLDEAGRLALLVGLTGAAFVGGGLVEKRGAPLGGAVLIGLGTQLLWAVGAQLIHMGTNLHGAGPVALLAAVVSAVTYGVALQRRATPLAVVAALDLAVFAGALGDYLHTGSVMGPPSYALLVGAGYALLAAGAARRGPASIAWPFALTAGAAAAGSAALGVGVLDDHGDSHRLLGALWPYLVAALAAVASRAPSPLGPVMTFVAGAVIVVAPTAEALVRETLLTAVIAVLIGAAALALALTSPRLRRASDARPEALLAALFGMLCAPGLRLAGIITRSDYDGAVPDAPLWWALVVATSLGLLAAGYAVTGRVSRSNHRLVEAAGVVPLLGAVSLQVMTHTTPLGPALVALGSAAALAAYGFFARRAVVFLGAAAVLLVQGWIQYFVRLEPVFPLSIRLVGFGVGLLVGGVLYEQQLRPRVAILRDWN
jgi:hypothetical protein